MADRIAYLTLAPDTVGSRACDDCHLTRVSAVERSPGLRRITILAGCPQCVGSTLVIG